MKKTSLFISAAVVALGIAPVYAGESSSAEKHMENAGNQVEQAAEATGSAIENAAESTGNAMQNAADSTGDAVERQLDMAEMVDPATASAEELEGADVVMENGDDVGSIVTVFEDDASEPESVVISVGGFLGVGDKFVEMKVSELSPAQEQGTVMISKTKAELEAMPAYDGKAVQNML